MRGSGEKYKKLTDDNIVDPTENTSDNNNDNNNDNNRDPGDTKSKNKKNDDTNENEKNKLLKSKHHKHGHSHHSHHSHKKKKEPVHRLTSQEKLEYTVGVVRRPHHYDKKHHKHHQHKHKKHTNQKDIDPDKMEKLTNDIETVPIDPLNLDLTVDTDTDVDEDENKYCNSKEDLPAIWKMLKGSWLNAFLFVLPFGFISYYLEWGDTAIFVLNFLAMIPLASILGDATEALAEHLGEVIGGLLNATFGNAVEIVVMIIALMKAKEYKHQDKNESVGKMIVVVQMSLIGSVFSNSLLVLGCCFVANGYKYKVSSFNKISSSANISLLMISAVVMILPSPYAENKDNDELLVSRVTAIILLLMYVCLIIFVLYSHKDLIDNRSEHYVQNTSGIELASFSPRSTSPSSPRSPRVRKRKKPDVENQDDQLEEVIVEDQKEPKLVADSDRLDNLSSNISVYSSEDEDDDDEMDISIVASVTLLLITTILIAISSEYLVDSIEGAASKIGMSEAFIGLILLPIIGNAVEHVTAIRMALKNKMDIALSIAIGSATQVAMFVVGLAVIIGWIIQVPMKLDFDPFEVQLFIFTSIIIFALISDGTSNWLSGTMLLALYFLIAVAVWDQKFDWCSYAHKEAGCT